MRWRRSGGGLVVDEWTPDTVGDRNERLAWQMRMRRPWKLLNGHLIVDPHEIVLTEQDREQQEAGVARALWEAMHLQRGQSKQMMRDLAVSGAPLAAEGTYGALGAYPLPTELAAFTPTAATEGALLTSAANQALYMPIPANSMLTPQAYRFVVAGRVTTSATAGNVTWTVRLGNANTSPSLGASTAIAKTVSITNAIFIIKGDITIQSVGAPGTNSRAMGHFDSKLNSAAGGAYIAWMWGSVAQASFDTTVSPNTSANGGQIWIGVTESAGVSPWTVGAVHYMDWN